MRLINRFGRFGLFAIAVAPAILPATSNAESLLTAANDPTFQTQGTVIDATEPLGSGPWSGTSAFPALSGVTGTGPTVVVGNGDASVEGLSTEANGNPISSYGAVFQTINNTSYAPITVYTLSLNIQFDVPVSINPLIADNIGIALTSGGSSTSAGTIVASSLVPNSSTVVTETPGFESEDVTLQFKTGNSSIPIGKLGIEMFAGADGYLPANTIYSVDNVLFSGLSLTSNPVPEPSVFGLIAAGLAAVAFALRRRVLAVW